MPRTVKAGTADELDPFAAVVVAGPNVVGSTRNSPQAFTKLQMSHHDVEHA